MKRIILAITFLIIISGSARAQYDTQVFTNDTTDQVEIITDANGNEAALLDPGESIELDNANGPYTVTYRNWAAGG